MSAVFATIYIQVIPRLGFLEHSTKENGLAGRQPY